MHAQLPQVLLRQLHQPLNILVTPTELIQFINLFLVFLVLMRITPSLNLLAVLLLAQPRMLVAIAANAHCWLRLRVLSAASRGSSFQVHNLALSPQNFIEFPVVPLLQLV